MKNLVFLFLLVATPCLAQFEVGNFKAENGKVVWQKVYEEDLPLESGEIKLRAVGLPRMTTTIFITQLQGADMKVEKKEGRTRITITNIFSFFSTSVSTGSYTIEGNPNTYAGDIYVSKNSGAFKKKFLKKDGRILNEIIEREISDLLPKDDW
jgi:hypothetical protein